MARTKDIEKLVEAHRAALLDISERSLQLEAFEAAERSWTAENLLFRAAVEWEVLSSAWLVAGANNNSAAVRRHITDKITESVHKAYPSLVGTPHLDLRVSIGKQLSVSMIEEIFAADGRNRGFWEERHLREWKRLLPVKLLKTASNLNGNDWMVLAVVGSSRHVIAHRSVKSEQRLNVALRACSHSQSSNIRHLAPGNRAINSRSLGTFLQATPRGSRSSRLQVVLQSLDKIAAKLIPSPNS